MCFVLARHDRCDGGTGGERPYTSHGCRYIADRGEGGGLSAIITMSTYLQT